ncbi:hypothetical protein J0A67_15165 [Algoriphagus aestuariicola]|uniref:Uncharacterized protein n=1 Tax=Algoriphagus aestuariicola TaxID=1852016 RepID=A0ABS3BSD2_9BACT|nr:hypothetical protein [Algoriphagus aestuariicola]MBN7802212.1 hypothetical protein [Algoriphagus aestuariicola]
MQPTRNARSLIGLCGLVLVFLVSNCTQFDGTDPNKDLDPIASENISGDLNARMVCDGPDVTPVLFTGGRGGNASCSDVCDFEYSSGRNDFVDGAFVMEWPEGFTVNVKDGKYVSWSFDPPEGYCLNGITVIVKGGPASNIYKYGPGVTSDCGLVSPVNASGRPAALSNLTFCYDLIEKPEAPEAEDKFAEYCEDDEIAALCAEAIAPEGATVVYYTSETGNEVATVTCLSDFGTLELWAASVTDGCESEERTKITLTIAEKENCDTVIDEDDCFQEETAWGGSSEGGGPAWWFYFDTTGDAVQPIYAGQNLTDGTITFDGNNLIIDLGSWVLQDDLEAVKIQGYNSIPTSRPAAGPFTTYKGRNLVIPVSGFTYYAIHLDVMLEIECPEPE